MEKPEGCKTVYVGNLAHEITDEIIQSVFSDCGKSNPFDGVQVDTGTGFYC